MAYCRKGLRTPPRVQQGDLRYRRMRNMKGTNGYASMDRKIKISWKANLACGSCVGLRVLLEGCPIGLVLTLSEAAFGVLNMQLLE